METQVNGRYGNSEWFKIIAIDQTASNVTNILQGHIEYRHDKDVILTTKEDGLLDFRSTKIKLISSN